MTSCCSGKRSFNNSSLLTVENFHPFWRIQLPHGVLSLIFLKTFGVRYFERLLLLYLEMFSYCIYSFSMFCRRWRSWGSTEDFTLNNCVCVALWFPYTICLYIGLVLASESPVTLSVKERIQLQNTTLWAFPYSCCLGGD